MRWTRGYRSDNVEDRRAYGPSRAGVGGGGLGILVWLFSRFGLPGVLVGGVVLYLMSRGASGGEDTAYQDDPSQQRPAVASSASEETAVQFVSFVLDDVQNTWSAQLGARYRPARLVLFRGSTESGCGMGSAESGPFYCPRDEKAYIDLSFYDELKQRFGAPGDFAQAYVIAHEIGHHVQHLLGTDARVQRGGRSELQGASSASVRLELQADCYAGVWAHATQQRNLLEAGDVDEALRAAAAIGDDRLQRQSTGTVSPDTFTHGTSAQRVHWFKRGFEQGKLESCDTFAASEP
jgi:predicted metalloprotease